MAIHRITKNKMGKYVVLGHGWNSLEIARRVAQFVKVDEAFEPEVTEVVETPKPKPKAKPKAKAAPRKTTTKKQVVVERKFMSKEAIAAGVKEPAIEIKAE